MLVGLTGGFGCGKSTVLKLFERLGAAVLSADSIVHDLLKREVVRDSIVEMFGPDILVRGEIDRKKLSARVFSDETNRKKIEKLLHPLVLETIEQTYKKATNLTSNLKVIMVVEIPLLFETGFDKRMDVVVVVRAEADVIRERLRRKGFSDEEIRARAAAQFPIDEKVSRADYVIDNSGSLEDTEQQVRAVWADLLRTRSQR
ncbi:Dephospho-CoA kinase [hydrothermal vent metagenome]|uniref:Dephospho-CoA kinase n=1 Tax=hydrothermal vent metagenome TaxID=652676 RepID=A0A3B1D578_9ZZZZ